MASSSMFSPVTTTDSRVVSTIEPGPKRKMTKGTIAGIAVGMLVVVAAVVFVIVYFTVIRHHNKNLGPNKFGSVTIEDHTSHSTGAKYQPGDTLLLKYAPTPEGFSGDAVWTFSSDNGGTFPFKIPGTGNGNSATWVIPGNVFSNKCVFKVADKLDLGDFVTTVAVPILPFIQLESGAGTSPNDVVYQNQETKVILDLDVNLLGINSPSDWQVKTSTNSKDFSNATVNQVTNIDLSTRTLTWIPANMGEKVFCQVSTTALVAHNYPSELSAVSAYSFDIKDGPPACPAGGTGFQICHVIMTSKKSGSSNNFTPGEQVTMQFNFEGTFSGLADWTYNTGTGSVPITPTGGPGTEGNTVQYSWIITPDTIFTETFVLSVASGIGSKESQNYTVQPSFTWNMPTGGDSVILYAPGSPAPHYLTTQFNFSIDQAATFIKWTVGTEKTGEPTVFYPDRVYRFTNNSPTQSTLIWFLDATDINLGHGQEEDVTLVFKAENSTGSETLIKKTATTVNFTVKDYNPVNSPQTMSNTGFSVGINTSNQLISDKTTTPLRWAFVPNGTFNQPYPSQHQGYCCVFDPKTPNNPKPACWVNGIVNWHIAPFQSPPAYTTEVMALQPNGTNVWGIHEPGFGCPVWSATQGAGFGTTNGCRSNGFFGWTADIF